MFDQDQLSKTNFLSNIHIFDFPDLSINLQKHNSHYKNLINAIHDSLDSL